MSRDHTIKQPQSKVLLITVVLSLALNLLACQASNDVELDSETQSSQSDQQTKPAPQIADLELEKYQALDLINPKPTAQNYKVDFDYQATHSPETIYFDAQGQPISAATSDGYYRKVLGKTSDDRTVMQDFYQNAAKPYTSPFIIRQTNNRNEFNDNERDGTTAWFDTDGQLISLVKNDKPGVVDTLILIDGSYVMRLLSFDNYDQMAITYYDDNEKINRILLSKEVKGINTSSRFISFYENGSAQGEMYSDEQNTKSQTKLVYTWDEQGNRDNSLQAEANFEKIFQRSKLEMSTIANTHASL